MTPIEVDEETNRRLDQIYSYTAHTWAQAQADRHLKVLFREFQAIADRRVPGKTIPSTLGVDGFRRHYRRHFIYWRVTSAGGIAIMTVLRDKMEQAQQLGD